MTILELYGKLGWYIRTQQVTGHERVVLDAGVDADSSSFLDPDDEPLLFGIIVGEGDAYEGDFRVDEPRPEDDRTKEDEPAVMICGS